MIDIVIGVVDSDEVCCYLVEKFCDCYIVDCVFDLVWMYS